MSPRLFFQSALLSLSLIHASELLGGPEVASSQGIVVSSLAEAADPSKELKNSLFALFNLALNKSTALVTLEDRPYSFESTDTPSPLRVRSAEEFMQAIARMIKYAAFRNINLAPELSELLPGAWDIPEKTLAIKENFAALFSKTSGDLSVIEALDLALSTPLLDRYSLEEFQHEPNSQTKSQGHRDSHFFFAYFLSPLIAQIFEAELFASLGLPHLPDNVAGPVTRGYELIEGLRALTQAYPILASDDLNFLPIRWYRDMPEHFARHLAWQVNSAAKTFHVKLGQSLVNADPKVWAQAAESEDFYPLLAAFTQLSHPNSLILPESEAAAEGHLDSIYYKILCNGLIGAREAAGRVQWKPSKRRIKLGELFLGLHFTELFPTDGGRELREPSASRRGEVEWAIWSINYIKPKNGTLKPHAIAWRQLVAAHLYHSRSELGVIWEVSEAAEAMAAKIGLNELNFSEGARYVFLKIVLNAIDTMHFPVRDDQLAAKERALYQYIRDCHTYGIPMQVYEEYMAANRAHLFNVPSTVTEQLLKERRAEVQKMKLKGRVNGIPASRLVVLGDVVRSFSIACAKLF